MADQFPERFGKYEIIKEVGQGGFADVYKAVDTSLDRIVALKFLEPRLLREPAFVERFQREAKLAANLKHPNIVFVHEFGREAGMAYIAMEFLEGQTLKEVLLKKEGLLPPRRIVNIVEQIALALDYAHGRGLVHRDIKPSNIMVGADDHVTVMDFGIAKAAALTALTTTGRIFGTPEYMSPEQAEGLEEPDARSDIYSLGVVVYEMFTGKVPFSDTMPLSVMRGHADKPPPRPSEINPDVSPAVEAVLLKALAKKREERYQSAGEMAAALQQAASESVVEEVKEPPEPGEPALAPVIPPAATTLPPKHKHTEPSETLDKGQGEGIVYFVPPTNIAPFLDEQLKDEGLHIENSRNRIASLSLDINDILVLTYNLENYIDLTDSEIDDLVSFVGRGGTLILAGHAWVWKQYENGTNQTFPLNRIAQRFGVAFIMGGANEISEIVPHQITEGVFVLPVDGSKFQPGLLAIHKEKVVGFLKDRHKRVIAAYSIHGNGKVIFFTHGGLFSEEALNSGDYGKLALNMFRWCHEPLHPGPDKVSTWRAFKKVSAQMRLPLVPLPVWFLLGFICTLVVAILFQQRFRCLMEYRVSEPIVALIVLLIGIVAAAFVHIFPSEVRRVLQVLIGGVASALLVSIVVALFLPSPAEKVCFPESTPTSTPTAVEVSVVATTPPAGKLASTQVPSPTMFSEKCMIEIDGIVIDASDDRCREITCNSSPRIQVTVLDSERVPLQPDIFSYNWRFNPLDSHNRDKLDSKNYAIIYSVPCGCNNQTVTIEVLKDGETLCVRRICFNIKKQP